MESKAWKITALTAMLAISGCNADPSSTGSIGDGSRSLATTALDPNETICGYENVGPKPKKSCHPRTWWHEDGQGHKLNLDAISPIHPDDTVNLAIEQESRMPLQFWSNKHFRVNYRHGSRDYDITLTNIPWKYNVPLTKNIPSLKSCKGQAIAGVQQAENTIRIACWRLDGANPGQVDITMYTHYTWASQIESESFYGEAADFTRELDIDIYK